MSIIDNVKEIATLIQKLGDLELYRKIVELEGEIIEITREKRQIEERLATLLRNQDIIQQLKLGSPFYVNTDCSELYCSRCIEYDRQAIHVVETGEIVMGRRVHVCPQCKTKYEDRR